MDKLLNFIKEKYPQNANDISESLELLADTLEDLRASVNKEFSKLAEKGEYEKIPEYTEYAKEIKAIQDNLDSLVEKLEITDSPELVEEEKEYTAKVLPNYEEYQVDNQIEHNLYEDFTHKRPFSFKLLDRAYNVKTWKDMLLILCEELYSKDKNIFETMITKPSMQGKRRKNFSKTPEELRELSRLKMNNSDIWIETNMSGNGIRNLIIKILKEYKLKVTDVSVYFRADYSELNKN